MAETTNLLSATTFGMASNGPVHVPSFEEIGRQFTRQCTKPSVSGHVLGTDGHVRPHVLLDVPNMQRSGCHDDFHGTWEITTVVVGLHQRRDGFFGTVQFPIATDKETIRGGRS